MNAKYAVTDDIRDYDDLRRFETLVTEGLSKRELTQNAWEELIDQAAQQVRAFRKSQMLTKTNASTEKLEVCPDGHPVSFKGVKKNSSNN
jgi:hypothetical protein